MAPKPKAKTPPKRKKTPPKGGGSPGRRVEEMPDEMTPEAEAALMRDLARIHGGKR